jgi:hypothetical protein
MTRQFSGAATDRGFALVVAMVLLLVLTMVAVIAMRSTTLDLKMSANTTLARRAFQASDGTREAVGPLLAAHVFYHGWPESAGGSVSDTADFDIAESLTVMEPSQRFDMGENGSFDELDTRSADIEFRADVQEDDTLAADDIYGDIWVTRVGVQPAPGTSLNANAADQGAGGGAASKYIFFDLRAAGRTTGNARSLTGADYRALSR